MLYTLFCIVLGESKLFSVKVDETLSVDELRKKIKNEKPFRFKDVDADELTLHKIKVDIDISDTAKYKSKMDEVSRLDCVFNPKIELLPMQWISEHFGDSDPCKEKTIHILVEPPKSKSIDP